MDFFLRRGHMLMAVGHWKDLLLYTILSIPREEGIFGKEDILEEWEDGHITINQHGGMEDPKQHYGTTIKKNEK